MASSACPICSRHFRTENLAMHVEFCLTRGGGSGAPSSSSSPSFPAPSKKRAVSTPPFSSSPRQLSAPFNRQSKTATPAPLPSSTAISVSGDGASMAPGSPSKKRKRQSIEPSPVPLAERMRPAALTDLVGQDELIGPGKVLSALIEADRVPNMILWGPPGCGKTTMAHVIARRTQCKFIALSGATSAAADVRDALERARGERKLLRRRTIVFVDEIHRFKKNQQDIFLPPVEDGTITLIGATTENPSFELNNALLSRCRVYTLQKHSPESIATIVRRALADHAAGGIQSLLEKQNGLSNGAADGDDGCERTIQADDAAIEYIANQCGGDARVALNCLEIAIQTAPIDENTVEADDTDGTLDNSTSKQPGRVLRMTEAHVRHCFAHRQTLFYDRNADFHYDLISAMHKSIRGSDANAALYWLARMLEGGENPLYIARRMIRMASEDIGLAAPELLPIAVSAYQAAHFLGMPECDVVLAHCATMLARAPKSIEVYGAYKRVKQSIREWDKGALPDVPMHLRNAPTRLMEDVGYGRGYLYNPHYTADELKDQTYLPDEMLGTDFFQDEDVAEAKRRGNQCK